MNAQSLIDALTGSSETDVSEESKKIKAYAWARVSTDMQEERGLSIPEQLKEIKEYAVRNDIEIVAEFHEAASAFQKDEKRIEFHRMVDAALKDREIRAIVIYDFSRFSRDSSKGIALLRKLQTANIRIISLNDPEMDPETSGGAFIEAITFAKNEAYSRDVAMHTKKGCRANIHTRDEETGWCYKNGGHPIWGYKNLQLTRGEIKKGTPRIKLIWVLDNTIVQGRPVHEWARHCLVNMAAKGASLKELRDFCNKQGLPPGRSEFWNISPWFALLEPHILMKYCGYEVWNVHRKNGKKRPPSEWIIVENAHEALITEEDARMIAESRKELREDKSFFYKGGRSMNSPYLLSGGFFKCGRCGCNMTGFKTAHGEYYVCGSKPYRRGMGCGPGLYVPKKKIEAEVIDGLHGLLGICTDPKGFTRQVNQELRRLWEKKNKPDIEAKRGRDAIDSKIANIRGAIEDGLTDAAWASSRIDELLIERKRYEKGRAEIGKPPQIDTKVALEYKKRLQQAFQQGEPFERKLLLRPWIKGIELTPNELDVEINYRIPDDVMSQLSEGPRYGSINDRLR